MFQKAFLSLIMISSALPVYAEDNPVFTQTEQIVSDTSIDGMTVAPTGNVTIKLPDKAPAGTTVTVTSANYVDIAGGSLVIQKGGTLNQTNPTDEQSLTIRDKGSIIFSEGSKGNIAGKADLTNSSMSLSGSKDAATVVAIGGDYISNNSSLSTSGNTTLSMNSITLNNNSSISSNLGTITNAGGITATDSSITLSGSQTDGNAVLNANGASSLTNSKLNLNYGRLNLNDNDFSVLNSVITTTSGSIAAKNIDFKNSTLSLGGLSIQSTGNITIDNSNITANHSALLATGTVDFKNGTHTFYGSVHGPTLMGSLINVAKNVMLTLDYGNDVRGTLNVDGNLNLIESKTQTLNVSGANAGNGHVNMKWNNFIDGDFNLTDNASMAMTKTPDHNSILTMTNGNMNVTNSKVDMDVGIIKNATGSVNFNDNSQVSLRIAGKDAASYGHVEAHTVNISNNNTSLNVILDAGVLTKQEGQVDFTLFDATSVNGQFSNLIRNNRYAIVYKGNGVYGITETTSAGDIVVGGDSEEVLDIRDMADAWLGNTFPLDTKGHEIQNILNTLSQTEGMEEEFTNALQALSPDTTPIVTSLSSTFNRQMANVIGARLEKIRARSRYGRSSSQIFEKQDGLWVQGLTNKIDYTGQKAFDAKNNGGAIGADYNITDGFKIGLGYSYTDTDANSLGRKTTVGTHLGAIYVDLNGDSLYFNTLASYGRSAYEEKKRVYTSNVDAKYDVDFWGVQSILGYDPGAMKMGRYGMGTLMPEIGARYMAITKKSYTDSAGQEIKESDANTATGIMGLHYTLNYDFGNVVIYPDLKAAVTYDFIQDELESVVALPNGLAYRVKEERLDKLGVEVGAELGIKLYKTVDLSLSYLGMFRKDYKDHTGFVNLKYHF